ncbi:MAG: hypothetical protein DMG61_16735 [Acidobacteria bacterium]|nr:MAG: hypothetical protein DMG61_16735 [Acidobacteriota bacterium]PYY20377.1 MAG: hypothetical protein DMG60_00305 [Acidobacteriota bacterium]
MFSVNHGAPRALTRRTKMSWSTTDQVFTIFIARRAGTPGRSASWDDQHLMKLTSNNSGFLMQQRQSCTTPGSFVFITT